MESVTWNFGTAPGPLTDSSRSSITKRGERAAVKNFRAAEGEGGGVTNGVHYFRGAESKARRL